MMLSRSDPQRPSPPSPHRKQSEKRSGSAAPAEVSVGGHGRARASCTGTGMCCRITGCTIVIMMHRVHADSVRIKGDEVMCVRKSISRKWAVGLWPVARCTVRPGRLEATELRSRGIACAFALAERAHRFVLQLLQYPTSNLCESPIGSTKSESERRIGRQAPGTAERRSGETSARA